METVVAMLVAWAIGKAQRVGHRVDGLTGEALDAAVDRVWAVVSRKLGTAAPIQQLVSQARETGDAANEARSAAEQALAEAAASDPSFEAELRAAIAHGHSASPTSVSNTGSVSRGSIVSGPINATGSVTVSASNKEKTINKVVNRTTNVVRQHRGPILAGGAVLLAVAVAFTACMATGEDHSVSAPTTSVAPSTTRASAAATPTQASAVAATPSRGLLTEAVSQDRHSVQYGVLDLASGNYTPFKRFAHTTATIWNPRHHISPDWKRIGASAVVGRETHAGWIDDAGQFTDVTVLLQRSAPTSGDFSKPLTHVVVGFDSAGDFYLQDQTNKDASGSKILRISTNAPSVGTEFGQLGRGSTWEHSYYWNWKHDLIRVPDSACVSVRSPNEFVWIDQNRYITAEFKGNHLLIWNSETTMCPLETGGANYESKLLPDDSPYRVSDPYVNPAGDTITFFSNTQNFAGMYTVPVNGGNPTRTGLTQAKVQNYRILRWV